MSTLEETLAPSITSPALASKKTEYTCVTFAIFAYNELATIRAAIDSALVAGRYCFGPNNVKVVVLANGCTDGTENVVRGMAQYDAAIELKVMSVADKSITWNRYVHDFANITSNGRLHVFMDGDVTCTGNVIQNTVRALIDLPTANACTVLPALHVGRNRDLNMQLYDVDGALFGNLYALTTPFMKRIRAKNIRMPRGAIGDDSLITEMVALDLDRNNEYDNRKAACAAPDCGFVYRSLNYWSPSDIRLQINRMVNYQIRTWQQVALQKINFKDFPETTESIEKNILIDLNSKRLTNPIQWLARLRLKSRI